MIDCVNDFSLPWEYHQEFVGEYYDGNLDIASPLMRKFADLG